MYFIRKNLQVVELNYDVTKIELLFFIYAINKFRHYTTGYSIFIRIGHPKICYLINKPMVNNIIV